MTPQRMEGEVGDEKLVGRDEAEQLPDFIGFRLPEQTL
jgi:hypothetical protein